MERDRAPVDVKDAARLASTAWGLSAVATELVGDVDRNFRLDSADGFALVLKVSRADTDGVPLPVRQEAADRVAALDGAPGVPKSVPTVDGGATTTFEASDGRTCVASCATWVPGLPLAEFSPLDDDLCRRIGGSLAMVDRAVETVDHPALDRESDWDLKRGVLVAARHTEAIDPVRRPLFDRMLGRVRDVASGFLDLPRTVIHGDANDHNLLIDLDAGSAVPGVIDFGDMVRSWRAAEPAIAAAYAAMDRPDAGRVLTQIVAGYHAVTPLSDAELDALPHLVTLRLLVSVALSAVRSAAEPDDDYLTVSERPAWDLLERLDATHPRLLAARLRAACGREPSPAGSAVSTWLRSVEPAPVVDLSAGTTVLDLSVGGTDAVMASDPGAWTRAIERRIGGTVGVGRYMEPRLCYGGDQFAAQGREPEFQRTVHLGVDLFAPPGSPVRAPYAGLVSSVALNGLDLDYGPTVILEHPGDGDRPPFWTLYGHLDPEVLDRLVPGETVDRGEEFARIGAEEHNGGWPPHVHCQVIADRLDRTDGDFPGVAFPSESDAWAGICPEPVIGPGVDVRYRREEAGELLRRRNRLIAPSLGLSYEDPLHLVRGIGTWMFDERGRRYLDCVNNVTHVGHGHPRVTEAAHRQMQLLNTNTRYLHENLLRLAERITRTLPAPLDTCIFVNSGSEANDLALRIARSATGRRGVIVVDGAYHGNLGGLVDVSPYKFDGPGGRGRPDHVRVVRMPDPYRGELTGEDAGPGYAADVGKAADDMERNGVPAAAFLAESILGCGGQIVPAAGWLAAAASHARDAGALYVADEVQTGFGRVGTHFWAFEREGVVPDVVTMGKPMGNGHPIGAVVTTRALAEAFDPGMEYFSSFGGSPVSCAVGLSVLDVIEDEGLQRNALETGHYLFGGLRALQSEFAVMGEVRGAGLFLGIELVSDPDRRTPDADAASYLANRARMEGVLLSTDGPDHNVIKIKPPLVFGMAECDRLTDLLRRLLGEDYLRGR